MLFQLFFCAFSCLTFRTLSKVIYYLLFSFDSISENCEINDYSYKQSWRWTKKENYNLIIFVFWKNNLIILSIIFSQWFYQILTLFCLFLLVSGKLLKWMAKTLTLCVNGIVDFLENAALMETRSAMSKYSDHENE